MPQGDFAVIAADSLANSGAIATAQSIYLFPSRGMPRCSLWRHTGRFQCHSDRSTAERGLQRDTGHFRTRNNRQAKTSMRPMKLGWLQDLFGKNTMQAKNEQKKLQNPSTTQKPKMTKQTSKIEKTITEDSPSTGLTVTQISKLRGAPSIYSKAIVEEICWRLGSGQTLKSICSLNHMPDVTTVFAWEQKYPELSKLSMRARGLNFFQLQ